MDEARRQWLLAFNLARRTGRQHRGPLTTRTLEVFDVLAEVDGPISYDAIAALVAHKHGSCCRSTVAAAVKTLRSAGLLAWEQRHGRVWRSNEAKPRWRAHRLQNVYRLLRPLAS